MSWAVVKPGLSLIGLLIILGFAAGRAEQAPRTLPPNTWVNLLPGGVGAGDGVGDEGWSTFVYSPGLKRSIVFGKYHAARDISWGENQNALMGYDFATNRWDLLEITEAAWSEFLPGVGHDQGRVAIDPRRDLYITQGNMTLHGNTMYQTYIYDLRAGRGQRMMPAQEPRLGHEVACAFDGDRGFMLCSRGAGWMYEPDKNVWTETSGSPSDRAGPGLVYDSKQGLFVLFGGGAELSETWVFQSTSRTWRKRDPVRSPPGRKGPNIAFDPVNGVTLVVGGVGPGGARLSDMWVYDAGANTWTLLPTPFPYAIGAPGGNLLTYDLEHGVFLLKESGAPALKHLWAFRYVPGARSR